MTIAVHIAIAHMWQPCVPRVRCAGKCRRPDLWNCQIAAHAWAVAANGSGNMPLPLASPGMSAPHAAVRSHASAMLIMTHLTHHKTDR